MIGGTYAPIPSHHPLEDLVPMILIAWIHYFSTWNTMALHKILYLGASFPPLHTRSVPSITYSWGKYTMLGGMMEPLAIFSYDYHKSQPRPHQSRYRPFSSHSLGSLTYQPLWWAIYHRCLIPYLQIFYFVWYHVYHLVPMFELVGGDGSTPSLAIHSHNLFLP